MTTISSLVKPVYQSLGSLPYIYKKDIYDILLSFAPEIDTLEPLQVLARNLVAYYLTTQKNKLTKAHEMIGYSEEFIQSLEERKQLLELEMGEEEWKAHLTTSPFKPSNDDDVLTIITELIIQDGAGAAFRSDMRGTIINVLKDLPVKENVCQYTRMLFGLHFTINNYMTLINENKSIFLSRSETVDLIPISKIPIRLFESNQGKMVMSHELLDAIKLEKLDVSGFEDRILAMPQLSTMNFREVFETVPSNIFKMLEFVKMLETCGEPSVKTTSSSDIPSSDEASESSSIEISNDAASDCMPSSSTVRTILVKMPEPIRKPKKTKKKVGKSAEKPEVKESQTCPKCIRASEYTTMTNEKLRLSKIEVKHLKKELSVAELAVEEKNEQIRILVEKLREKENQLNLKSSEVETLNTKKQELQKKNERNERLIATFHKVISKKDSAIKSMQCQNYEKDKLIKELTAEESKIIPSRSAEESERVDSLLSSLLETKTILSKEDPIQKSNEICDSLISKVNSKVNQKLVKYETKIFQLQVSSFIQNVESNIKLIRGNQHITMERIPEMSDFPTFSEEFQDVHKSIMKKEAPLLCRQLLKLTDEIADMECVICINEMESHDDTTKCAHCKRRYHNHCIKDWLKKKSICPTCKYGMIDEQEFPAL